MYRKKTHKTGPIFAIVAAMLIFAIISAGGEDEDYGEAGERVIDKIAEYYGGTDFDGNAVSAENFAGAEVTVLNIWTTDCHYCLEEMPVLDKLAAEYADKGLNVVGVCAGTLGRPINKMTDEERAAFYETARAIAAENGANYTQVFPSDEFMSEIISPLVVGYPYTIFLDSAGRLMDVRSGAADEAMWAKLFDNALAGD